jgi:hypothetical protein
MKAGSHIKVAVVLGVAGGVSVLAVFPYLLEVMPAVHARLAASPVPMPLIMASQCAEGVVVLALISWVGLRLGAPLALDAPWVRRAVERGGEMARPASSWGLAIALGLGAGVAIVLIDLFLKPLLPSPLQPLPASVQRWKGFAAAFYGGISEEIQVRLFVMTVLAWIGARIAGRKSGAVYWSAIVLAALILGAAHFPLAFAVFGTGFVNIARTLILNGLGGVVFGWLFWRRGLEHAMLAHFSADLVVHGIMAA